MAINSIKIAGIDEVGRGSLFGPVFAGVVVLASADEVILENQGVNDSKALTAKQRARLVPLIKDLASFWALGQASSKEIDKHGIQLATEKAMLRALQKLPKPMDLVLVDGLLPIRDWEGEQEPVVSGDKTVTSIAAASILAKQARDELITRLAYNFQGYGLEKNMGYGTIFHRKALTQLGPSSLHRKSFLKKILS